MEWSLCFLCLAELDQKGNTLTTFKKAFSYLVSDSAIATVLSPDSDSVRPEGCRNCLEQLIKMKALQCDLEVIQFKLIDTIKTLRTRIINNSKLYGNNDYSKAKLGLFEEWLQKQNSSGNPHQLEKQLVDNLYSFQSAVYDRSRESVQLPLVYLQPFSNHSGISIQSDLDSAKLEIKTEDNFSFDKEDDFELLPSPGSPDVNVNLLERKRGRRASKKRSIAAPSQHQNNDNPQDEDYSPTRKKHRSSLRNTVSKTPRLKTQRLPADVAKTSTFLSSRSPKAASNKSRKVFARFPRATIHPTFVENVREGTAARQRFRCNLCDFNTRFQVTFEQHVRGHESSNPDKTLSCINCPEKFSTQLGLDFHNSYHSGFFSFRCQTCNEKILPLDLAEHMATHGEEVFPCPNCSYCCPSREKYIAHLKRHSPDTGKFICDICTNNFPNRNKLILHLNQVHRALEEYRCPVEGCGKRFSLQEKLNLHMALHKNPVDCQVCRKPCKDLKSLENHMKVHLDKSSREGDFACSKCPAKFISRNSLVTHMIKLHGSSKFKCETCGVEYKTKATLLEHNNLVHLGITWKCTVEGCGAEYGNAKRLRFHTIRRHIEKPPDVCEECGMEFRSEGGLKKHLASHADKREHVCPQCGKGFNAPVYLKRHMLIHQDVRKFVCETCGKGFNRHEALKSHGKTHKPK